MPYPSFRSGRVQAVEGSIVRRRPPKNRTSGHSAKRSGLDSGMFRLFVKIPDFFFAGRQVSNAK